MDNTWFYILVLSIIFIGYSIYANRKTNKILDSDNFIRLLFFVLTCLFGIFVIYARHIGYLTGTKLLITVAIGAIAGSILILSNVSFNTKQTVGYRSMKSPSDSWPLSILFIIIGAIILTLIISWFLYRETFIQIGIWLLEKWNQVLSNKF